MRYIPPPIHATDQGKRAAITFCHSIDSSVVKNWSQVGHKRKAEGQSLIRNLPNMSRVQ